MTRPNKRTTIGNWVNMGHGVIVHHAAVYDWVVLSMGSIVPDRAVVGEWTAAAEGVVCSAYDQAYETAFPSLDNVAGLDLDWGHRVFDGLAV